MTATSLLDLPDAPRFSPAPPGSAPDGGQPSGAATLPGTRRAPPGRRIELPPYDMRAALALEREMKISHTFAQILVRRGCADAASVRDLLAPCERHGPGCFSGIEHVLDLIERHLRAGSRIVVHGDYDVDGVCSTAVLVRALRCRGADPGWYIPSRSQDGYGLAEQTVARLAARGTGLLITVDCGITAAEQVAAARAAGIDVIVTDHHSPRADGILPDCPILHPGVCGYPSVDLCGTGVAHKLAEALGASSAEADVELVALATVADLMPLQGENRQLVREGLRQLSQTARPGLRALMEVSGTDPGSIDASALGFRLGPRINASGRLRRADAALELLLTDDPGRARQIADELDRVNRERRAVEQRMSWEAEALAEEMGERSAYVLAGVGWHPGVVGIVASRIVERFHRPALLIALDEHDPGAPAQGSGRSIPGFDLLAGLDASAEYLLRYGGHRAAAGLTVLPELIGSLRESFERHAEEVLSDELLEPVELVDAVVCGSELTLELAEELLALEPCGSGNPAVSLLVSGARIDAVQAIGEGRHARFVLTSGGARARAVSFGCDGRVPGADGEPVDATFRLERNAWQGRVEPRLILRHAAPCACDPIERLGVPEDYVQDVIDELERPRPESAWDVEAPPAAQPQRAVLDRRGRSPFATIADARAVSAGAGGELVVFCAESSRRLSGLSGLTGGFKLISEETLLRRPGLLESDQHVVVLDPPRSPACELAILSGTGFAHFAWGEPELSFTRRVHELEYVLRPELAALYRELRLRRSVEGKELELLLRGAGSHPRSPVLAARLIRVLSELQLLAFEPGPRRLSALNERPTELERSHSYRLYSECYEEGLKWLTRARPSADG